MSYDYTKKINKYYDDRAEGTDNPISAAGQWFPKELTSEICEEIISRIDISEDDLVLEIGSGSDVLGSYVRSKCKIYVGIDISWNRIQKGHLVLSSAGISREDYEVHLAKDCLLKELQDQRFDVIWANSVLTHMPERDIREFLFALKAHLKQGGIFFFTFSPSERLGVTVPKQEKIKNFYYPTSYLKDLFEDCGYNFEVLLDGHAQMFESPTVSASPI